MLALVLATGMLLTGCTTENPNTNPTGTQDPGTNAPTGAPTEEPTETPTEGGEPTPEPAKATLTVNGLDISEYAIIYEAPADKSALGNYWRADYDSGKVTAELLAKMIKDKFGVELRCYPDVGTKKTAKEILIGKTNRTESTTGGAKTLGWDGYYIGLNNGKLVIRGQVAGVTYHALDEIKAFFEATAENDAYVIDESFVKTGTYKMTNIAMLGDSITYGALSTNYTNNGGLYGYAKTFARMNWRDCRVSVYATPGICLRTDLNGFMTNNLWTQFLNMSKASKFDVLMVMLGTNDGYTDAKTGSTWDGVWTTEDDASFVKSLEDLVTAANTANPGLKTVVMNCPVYYRSGDPTSPYYHASHYHVTPHTLELQAQGVENLRAKGVDVHLFDMNTFTVEKTTASMFSDLLHPDDQGHFIMAQGVSAMFQLLMKGETNKYLIN